jgi:hypothetical protein
VRRDRALAQLDRSGDDAVPRVVEQAMTRLAIGFTGTRDGMTGKQRASVALIMQDVLARAVGEGITDRSAHHGDCVGADAEFHELVRLRPVPWAITMVVHPGPAGRLSAGCGWPAERRPRLPFMERNANIVAESTVMIAAPVGMTEERSGTWATINMARHAERPLAIAWPDGFVTWERWP